MTNRSPDQHQRKGLSLTLALLAHAAFFGLIIFGVSWRNTPAPTLTAELYNSLPPVNAKPVDSKPVDNPPPVESPPPPPPAPPPPAPSPPTPLAPAPKPDPRIEQAKQADIAAKAEREKQEKLQKEKLAKLEADKAEKLKQDKLKQEKVKQDADKRKLDDDKRRAEIAKSERELKNQLDEKLAAQARAADIARRESEMQAANSRNEQKRLIDGYIDRIRSKIQGRANVPDSVPPGTRADFKVITLPTGDVLSITLVRSSGNPAFDQAIERAIKASQPLPMPKEPELVPQFRELILPITHQR